MCLSFSYSNQKPRLTAGFLNFQCFLENFISVRVAAVVIVLGFILCRLFFRAGAQGSITGGGAVLAGAYFFTAGGAGVAGFLAFVFYAVVAFVNA